MSVYTDLLRVNGVHGDSAMLQDILVGYRMSIGFPLSCLVRFDGAKVHIVGVSDARGDAGLTPGPCPKDAEVYFQMLRDQEVPEVVRNTFMDPLCRFLRWIKNGQIGAIASISLTDADGRIIGAMCAFSPIPTVIAPKDIKLAGVLARIASNMLPAPGTDVAHTTPLRQRVRNVMGDERVDIHLQPIMNLSSTKVRGYEALTRFLDDANSITPRTWFEEARRVGMQPLIECAAIAEAVDMLRFLPRDTYLSVNASPEVVRIGAVAEILRDAQPERIVIDLTEHEDADDLEGLELGLAELRTLGVQIALDNFGAGDLQMPTVVRLQPDILKLDMSLVKSINRRQNSQDLTRAIVAFAEDIGATLIAVGIEHESERATLAELGVPFGQGFLLAKPDAPDSFGLVPLP